MAVLTVPMLMVLPMRAEPNFGKSAADLTLLESAILAGLPNAPSCAQSPSQGPVSRSGACQACLEPHAGIGFY